MRKIIVTTMVTIDGVMQAPGASKEDTDESFEFGGWTGPYNDSFTEKEFARDMTGQFDLLLGRKTYEIFAGYWPQHAEGWSRINNVTKYVVSKDTSLALDWQNSVLINGDVPNEIRKLKKSKGLDIEVWGSSNLVQILLKNDLVDELRLKTYPITLGNGKKLFQDGAIPLAFKLLDCQFSPQGVIFANYKREGEIKTESF